MTFPFPKPFPGPVSATGYEIDALGILSDEWDGLALDFIGNTYACRVSLGAERLLGVGPYSAESGLGVDFIDNTYAAGV